MTSLVLSTVTRAQSTHQIGGCSIESGGEEFPAVLEFLSYAGHRSGPANHQCLGELCSAYYCSYGGVSIIAINNEVK